MFDAPSPALVQPFVRATSRSQAPLNRHSVYAEAEREADVFKWLESERAGRDLGEEALRRWARQHWSPFLRACWRALKTAASWPRWWECCVTDVRTWTSS